MSREQLLSHFDPEGGLPGSMEIGGGGVREEMDSRQRSSAYDDLQDLS